MKHSGSVSLFFAFIKIFRKKMKWGYRKKRSVFCKHGRIKTIGQKFRLGARSYWDMIKIRRLESDLESLRRRFEGCGAATVVTSVSSGESFSDLQNLKQTLEIKEIQLKTARDGMVIRENQLQLLRSELSNLQLKYNKVMTEVIPFVHHLTKMNPSSGKSLVDQAAREDFDIYKICPDSSVGS